MTWTQVVSSGGKYNLRLSIEGWPDEWVTHSDIAGTAADGRERREGLSYEGIVLEERVDLRSGLTEASAMTVTIRSPNALAAFATKAKVVSHLRSNATDSATTLNTSGHTSITTNKYYHINTETVKITAKAGSSPNWTVTATRQQWGTKAQQHFVSSGFNASVSPIYDRPPSMHGRRAILYGYSLDQTGVGASGTQLWIGIVEDGPKLQSSDGLTWRITIRPITDLLKTEVAQTSEISMRVRGIRYNASSPLYVRVVEYSQSTHMPTATGEVLLTGFWETKAAMIVDLNTSLSTAISGMTLDELEASNETDGRIKFRVKTDASTATNVGIAVHSVWDGATWAYSAGGGFTNTKDEPVALNFATGTNYYTYSAAKNPGPYGWIGRLPGFLQRGGNLRLEGWIQLSKGSANSTDPYNRLYLDTVSLSGISTGDNITISRVKYIENTAVSPNEVKEGTTVGKVTAVDTTNGYIDITPGTPEGANQWNVLGLLIDSLTEIRVSKQYTGNVHDFLLAVTADAVDVNLGMVPSVTTDDVDVGGSSTWETVVEDQVTGVPYLDDRIWAFNKGVKLSDVLSHELKMIGAHIYLDTNGKMALAKLEQAVASDSATAIINKDKILTPPDGSWPAYQLNQDGLVNIVEVYGSYDSKQDAHTDHPIIVNNLVSVAEHRNRGTSTEEIKPKSRSPKEPLTQQLAQSMAFRLFAFFAHDYHLIEIDVLLTLYLTATVGAKATLTCDHVPASDGTMGVTTLPAIVVGRRWNLDPAAGDPPGRLTLAIHRSTVAGYAPAARVASAVDNGSDNWTLTVTGTKYAAAGVTDRSHFVENYKVLVTEFDVDPQNAQTGTIIAVFGNNMTVQFDGTAPWGASFSGTYDVRFKEATSSAQVVGNQANYVYIADVDREMYDTSIEPREFS